MFFSDPLPAWDHGAQWIHRGSPPSWACCPLWWPRPGPPVSSVSLLISWISSSDACRCRGAEGYVEERTTVHTVWWPLLLKTTEHSRLRCKSGACTRAVSAWPRVFLASSLGKMWKRGGKHNFFISLMAHVKGKITKPFGKKELTFEVPTVQCTVYVHYVHC